MGLRLGQNSEFSLLIAYMAAGFAMIGKEASHLIQATAIITFVASSYIVVLNCPEPDRHFGPPAARLTPFGECVDS